MAQAGQAPGKGATKKSFIALAILFILIGGAMGDPQAAVACFVLAGIVSLVAFFSGPGWPRYVAAALLAAAVGLAFSNYKAARQHHQNYRSSVGTNSSE